MHTITWLENLKGRDHSKVPEIDGKIILQWIFGKCGEKLWTELVWIRIGKSGRPLRTC
jgi:hypothetical protein